MQIVRGLFRLLVVGFTVVSLMLVAAVAVSATSGQAGSSTKNSVVALFAGHPDQTVAHNATTSTSVTTNTNKAKENNGKDNGKDKHNGKEKEKDDDQCKPEKNDEGTPGRKHHDCDTDHDSG